MQAKTLPPTLLFPLLLLASALALVFAASTGSSTSSAFTVILEGFGADNPELRQLITELRVPRSLTAFGTGACLALAGVLMQVLLRNPLADPYILGTSGGAAAATLLGMLLGFGGWILQGWAFAGALGSTLLVFSLAHSQGTWNAGRLLLTGVVVAAGWSAIVSLMLSMAPDRSLRGMLFWLMGDFDFAGDPAVPLLTALAGGLACLALARSLNLLAAGDRQALLLGLAVRPLRILIYFLSALLTSVAVTTAGTVGFVGLVIPHLVRLLGGADHRIVVPASALAGGALLVVADTLARTLLAPRQLPVGVLTAMIGVPVFLLLLNSTRTRQD